MVFDSCCMYLGFVSGTKDDRSWWRYSLLSDDFTPLSVYSDSAPMDGLKQGSRVLCKFKLNPDQKTSFYRLRLLSCVPDDV